VEGGLQPARGLVAPLPRRTHARRSLVFQFRITVTFPATWAELCAAHRL